MVTVYMRLTDPEANGSREARALLRDALEVRWPGRFGDLPAMETGIYGKPYFPFYPQVHFNFSHTKGCVCCALADEPVGVDVELMRPRKYRDGIVKKFSAQEQKLWENTPQELREKIFFQLWVCKESYIKADGRGMSLLLDSFSVNPDEAAQNYQVIETEEGRVCLRLYDLGKLPYQLAVCSRDRELASAVQILTQGELPQKNLEK